MVHIVVIEEKEFLRLLFIVAGGMQTILFAIIFKLGWYIAKSGVSQHIKLSLRSDGKTYPHLNTQYPNLSSDLEIDHGFADSVRGPPIRIGNYAAYISLRILRYDYYFDLNSRSSQNRENILTY